MRKIDITKGKVLFSCFHVDELTAYEMIKNKEQLTPINAPIGDLEMALIANPQSPYGFSAISKWDKDKWEYMGLGNSGACSIVTALLKELQAKEQECLTLINKINRLEEEKNTLQILIEGKNNQYNAATQECEKLKKQYNCYACGTCNGKEDYKNMQRHCEKAIAQNHKYIQALEEISEIANADYYQDSWATLAIKIDNIKDIINNAKESYV